MLVQDMTIVNGMVRTKDSVKDDALFEAKDARKCININSKDRCSSGADGQDINGWRRHIIAGDDCPFINQKNFICSNYKR